MAVACQNPEDWELNSAGEAVKKLPLSGNRAPITLDVLQATPRAHLSMR